MRTARVAGLDASDPACGSVSANEPTAAPLASGRSQRSFCASVPILSKMMQVGELCTATIVETAPSPAAISSSSSGVGHRIDLGAVPLGRRGRAEEAELAQLAHDLRLDARGLLALGGAGRQPFGGEPPRGLDDQGVRVVCSSIAASRSGGA